jgi:hypothetical protein
MTSTEHPINTRELQERFRDVYRSFFLAHEIVVSADLCFPLTPGLAWQAGAPEIFHKLPLRAYVGVRREGSPLSCRIARTQVYDSVHDAFDEAHEPPLPWPLVEAFLCTHLREQVPQLATGITIDLLIETVEQRGLSAPIASLMIAAIRLMCGEDLGVLDAMAHHPSSSAFLKHHAQANTLRAACYFGTSHGTKEYAGVVATQTPSVYFAEERQGSIQSPVEGLFPLDVSSDLDRLSQLHWWGYALSDFQCQGDFPLDVVSLHQEGFLRDYRTVASHVKQSLMPAFDALRDEACTWFEEAREGAKDGRLPAFLKETSDGAYFQQFIRGHSIKHLELLRSLIELYQEPLDTSAALHMLETIDSILNSHAPFVELPSDYTMLRIREIKRLADEMGIPVAIRALHWGKQDGNLMVYSRVKTFREPLLQLVETWSTQKTHRVFTDFLSWRDGFGSEGLKVDQHVERGRIAAAAGEGIQRLTVWNRKSGYRSSLVGMKDDVPVDVLFDASTHRVLVAGKTVTSKELPSQKATVDIFAQLFRALGSPMPGRDLPARTYSNYRNELQGKILGPLDALVEERCGKPMGAHIQGSLTEFQVTCDPRGLTIGLRENLV